MLHINKHIYLSRVSSTNDHASSILSINDPKDNICIYTYDQSAGRGQIGRKWYCGTDKNLACSFLIRGLNFPVNDQFVLNQAFALAIHDFISRYISDQVTIKWPNDIYVGDNKIAGILIQNSLKTDKVTSTILGVGININSKNFPENLPNPTSLSLEKKSDYGLQSLVLELTACVETRLQQLIEGPDTLQDPYMKLLYKLHEEHTFIVNDRQVKGIIQGVNHEGKLELEISGSRKFFVFREISFLV